MNVTNKQDNNAPEDKNESSHNSRDSKYSEVDTNMVSIENMSLQKSCEEEVFYYYDSNDEIDCYIIPKNIVNLKYSKETTDTKRSDGNISNIKTKKSKTENCSGKKTSNTNMVLISKELREFLCTVLEPYEDSDPEISEPTTEEESDDDELCVDEWLSSEYKSTKEKRISSNITSSAQSTDDSTIGLLNHLREELGLFPLNKKVESYDIPTFTATSILTGNNLFNLLKDVFPNSSTEYLKNISESQAVSQKDDMALTDLFSRVANADETICTQNAPSGDGSMPSFIRCRLFPPPDKSNALNLEFDNLFWRAKEEFIKTYGSGTSVPSIKCVDYIYNEKLHHQFKETQIEFSSKKIPCNERRLFHGTHNDSIRPIIEGNFDINAKPVGRSKASAYGSGIYFSNYPSTSFGYGGSLLLCRVLTGTESSSQGAATNTFRSGINSTNDTANIYVVKATKQILPCYIIHIQRE